ncbi:MAG: AAA family ATPase, partial [Myxococcales bacterium]|nr:AAA family ATPase [Myxococcales bacterium]
MDEFVGRTAELEELHAAFDEGARLVTLRGPAGIGKTRLARELMEGRDDAVFVDLSDLTEPSGVQSAFAEALELPDLTGPGGRAGSIEHALSARGSALFVVDNFEHLLEAKTFLARCLEAAPELRLLVTSRERLGLPHEHVLPVGPLELPDAAAPEEAESVRLMIARARQLRHGYRVRDDELATVARIAHQLDGIPLALELAAPRLVFLGAKTLLSRLEERFALLRGEVGTLHGAIQWSWNLLDEAEQQTLAQCSVFRGGFDLEAGEAVIELPGQPVVMDVLQSLFEKSLLRADSADGRFGLFNSIRDFAASHLEGSARDATRARHAAYYVGLADRVTPELRLTDPGAAWRRLRAEKENLRAAVRNAPEPTMTLRAAMALAPIMSAQGPFEEFDALLSRGLETCEEPALRAAALLARVDARRFVGRLDAAAKDLEEAFALAEAVGDVGLLGEAVSVQGNLRLHRGELDAAHEAYERALPLHRAADDRYREAQTLTRLAATLGPLGRAEACRDALERAREMFQSLGALRNEGMVTAYLGNLFIDAGQLEDARICFARAEAIQELVGDAFGAAFTTANRAILQLAREEHDEAEAAFDAAILGFSRIGARRYEGAFLGYRALTRLARDGDLERAQLELRDVVTRLGDAVDERFQALFLAYLGGCAARDGALEQARVALDKAEKQIGPSGDPNLALAVRLQRAHLLTGAERQAILDEATSAEGGPAPMTRSADVLFSYRTHGRPDAGRARPRPDVEEAALVVGPDAEWFTPPGDGRRIDLGKRFPLRRTLMALVTGHAERPEAPVTREALVAAAWPLND